MQARLWALLCAGVAGSPLFADQVINDDLIVVGNACIGFDCTANQTFPVSGIDLRENNTRLSFNSDAFVLAANQTSIGELNEFRIQANGSGSGGQAIVTFATGGTGVTLGLGSTREADAVSVGAAASERQVTGVADALNDDDLINLSQLQAATAPDDLAPAITAEAGRLGGISASTAALSAIQPNPRATRPLAVSFGLGIYQGETAVAAGLTWQTSGAALLKISFADSNQSTPMTALSLSFAW